MPVFTREYMAQITPVLKQNISKLSQSSQAFASDLVRRQESGQQLSYSQMEWLEKMYMRATAAPAPVVKNEALNLLGVVKLLQTAAQHLKQPKVRVGYNGTKYVLSLAGARSKFPGSVNVTTVGSFTERTWFGRIHTDGMWEASRNSDAKLLELLQHLATDATGAAKAYGQRYNHCCFCGLELIDARSVNAGFGPICAEHYGLSEQWAHAADKKELIPA